MPATLANVRRLHAEQARAVDKALKRALGDAIEFTQPKGGLFFWVRLTGAGGKAKDATGFAKKAIEQGVAFVFGAPFYASNPNVAMPRLGFATADVGRLGRAL